MSEEGRELATILGRELGHVADEIAAYRDEQNLWVTVGAQRNAPGTLALHLAGNLLHYVGAELGGTGYVRDRPAEFGDRDVPRAELLRRLTECRETVTRTLGHVEANVLAGLFPGELPPALAGMTTRGFLTHLIWHLGWHTGQIYYHRLATESPEASTGV
jgi:hypothetical protein